LPYRDGPGTPDRLGPAPRQRPVPPWTGQRTAEAASSAALVRRRGSGLQCHWPDRAVFAAIRLVPPSAEPRSPRPDRARRRK